VFINQLDKCRSLARLATESALAIEFAFGGIFLTGFEAGNPAKKSR
jgi:hypothetical protein